MGFLTNTQATLAAKLSVFYGELYQVGFKSGTAYYWDGFGDLDAWGQRWEGRASLVQRSEIPYGVDDEAGELTLTLSGVNEEIVALVRSQEEEFSNRPITIWGQFFAENLQPSDSRFFLFGGTMDVPTYGGSDGANNRSIVISCEGEWADRNGSRFEFFSDLSQQQPSRFPGDRGLEYVYRYNLGVKRKWPKF